MGKGYMGNILLADASQRKMETEAPPDGIYKNFLCGYGLGAKIVYDRQNGRGIDPLGEKTSSAFARGYLPEQALSLPAGIWLWVNRH
jgi:aldehyde:ferredoxin oxidoreductase